MSELSNMNGGGLNNLPLVQGVKDWYIRWGVAKEAVNWRTMDDAFNSISKHARVTESTKAYLEPRYKDITTISAIFNQQRVSNKFPKCMFRENNWSNNIKQIANKTNQAQECYYCYEPNHIPNCMRFKANEDKYILTTQKVKSKYLEKKSGRDSRNRKSA